MSIRYLLKNKIAVAGAAVLMISALGQVSACDLHEGGGFGFGLYGGQQPTWHASRVDTTPKIKLTYPFVTKVTTRQLSDITVAYDLPIGVENATLNVKPSTQLAVKGDKTLSLSEQNGSYAIQVEANEIGQHVLTLNVSAVQNNKPVNLVRRVYINAQAVN